MITKDKIAEKLNEIQDEYNRRQVEEDFKPKYSECFIIASEYNSMRCVLEELLEMEGK